MNKNRMEINKEQLIQLLSSQLIEFSCVTEWHERILFEDRKVWSGRGMNLKEGVALITPYHKSKDNSLLIKMWEDESDIPNDDIWKDNSENVENLLISDESCKYFIFYKNYCGLTLRIENLIGDEDKIGTEKVIYKFTFNIKQI